MTRAIACLITLTIVMAFVLIIFIPTISPDTTVRYSPFIRQILWARQIKKDAGGYEEVYGQGGLTSTVTETFRRRVCSWGSDPVLSILPYMRTDGGVEYGALRACEVCPPDRRFIPPLFSLLSSKYVACRELSLRLLVNQPISLLLDEKSIQESLLSIYPEVRIGIWDVFSEGGVETLSPAIKSAVAEGKRLYGHNAFGAREPGERILRKASESKE